MLRDTVNLSTYTNRTFEYYKKIYMENKKKIIGYISEKNPFTDRKAWSGTIFKIREGIENAGYEVRWICSRPNGVLKFLCRGIAKLMYRHIKINYNRAYCRLSASSINKKLYEGCDYLFVPCNACLLPYLPKDIPIIFYTDTTHKLMVGYYWKKKLPLRTINHGEACEQAGISRATLNLRSSNWAAESVVKDYGYDPQKSYVIEFGANIDESDLLSNTLKYAEGETINILFSGVEWERKGGDIAVETVRLLNERGIKSQLVIAGIKKLPQQYVGLPYINYVGFLNKNNPEEYKRYVQLWRDATIFLLPTQAECSAIVYCEASAYGVPIFTYNTGGTSNYVIDGINGYKLSPSDGAAEFADRIERNLNKSSLQAMHEGGIRLYKKKLSWPAWSNRFREIMKENGMI